MSAPYADILRAVLARGETENYAGYSKFDALSSPIVNALSFQRTLPRLVWTQIVSRSPVNVRPLLRVPKEVNPKGVALFARANLTLYERTRDESACQRARTCLEWLLQNDSRRLLAATYHGACWGYNHAWQGLGFYLPRHYPNCVVTVFAADALLHGYCVLGDERYLDTARSSADFILNDLTVFSETADEKCIAYVPNIPRQYVVINNNALAAAFLAKLGAVTHETELTQQARKMIRFVVNARTAYDAWYYTTDPNQSHIAHDNYHTGGILDALGEYADATGDAEYHSVYARGLAYYKANLFMKNGAPKWMNNQTYPLDIHGAAQGILSFALAGDLEFARTIADWTIENLYKGNGNFSYQKFWFYTNRFTDMRWCNAWMARALSVLTQDP